MQCNNLICTNNSQEFVKKVLRLQFHFRWNRNITKKQECEVWHPFTGKRYNQFIHFVHTHFALFFFCVFV